MGGRGGTTGSPGRLDTGNGVARRVEVVRATHEWWRRGDSARELRSGARVVDATPRCLGDTRPRGTARLPARVRGHLAGLPDRARGDPRCPGAPSPGPLLGSGRGKGSGVETRARPTGIWTGLIALWVQRTAADGDALRGGRAGGRPDRAGE